LRGLLERRSPRRAGARCLTKRRPQMDVREPLPKGRAMKAPGADTGASGEARTDDPPSRRRWLALVVLAAAQFMVFLDETVVNVALPSIKGDFGFSQATLAWVVSAYMLTFGGLLLLGGRAADLFGRRRMFLAGTA